MDYRRRKYYAIRLHEYKKELELLKESTPSLKILEPYNHFKCGSHAQDHDCNAIGNYIQIVVSCLIEESENFEATFYQIPDVINNFTGLSYKFIMELDKYNLGQ